MQARRQQWISATRTGKLWHLRPEGWLLAKVAGQAGVKFRYIQAPRDSAGGRGSPTYLFDAAAAERVAPDIIDGVFEFDPTWSTDTPEGLRIYRWNRVKAALSVFGFLGLPLFITGIGLLIRFLRH